MVRLFSLLIVLFTFVSAQTPDSLFNYAGEAIEKEQYQKAIDAYNKILSQGVEHPNLYYNLGNGYYRTGKTGLAVWAYEKGLQMSPRDKDIQFNLKITNTQVRDRIESPKSIFILEWYRALKNQFTLADMLFIGGSLFLIAAILYISSIWIVLRYRTEMISAAVILSVIIHFIAVDKYWDISDVHEGIIITKEVKVFTSPFEREDGILFHLHEGIKVQITQFQTQWMEISLLDGKKGWVRSNHLREL